MKSKILALAFKAYIIYSLCADAILVSGIIWLLLETLA
jgi:hypothetical protein